MIVTQRPLIASSPVQTREQPTQNSFVAESFGRFLSSREERSTSFNPLRIQKVKPEHVFAAKSHLIVNKQLKSNLAQMRQDIAHSISAAWFEGHINQNLTKATDLIDQTMLKYQDNLKKNDDQFLLDLILVKVYLYSQNHRLDQSRCYYQKLTSKWQEPTFTITETRNQFYQLAYFGLDQNFMPKLSKPTSFDLLSIASKQLLKELDESGQGLKIAAKQYLKAHPYAVHLLEFIRHLFELQRLANGLTDFRLVSLSELKALYEGWLVKQPLFDNAEENMQFQRHLMLAHAHLDVSSHSQQGAAASKFALDLMVNSKASPCWLESSPSLFALSHALILDTCSATPVCAQTYLDASQQQLMGTKLDYYYLPLNKGYQLDRKQDQEQVYQDAVQKLRLKITERLLEEPEQQLSLICHGEGARIMFMAIESLSKNMQQKLHVHVFSPRSKQVKEGAFKVTDHRHAQDNLSQLSQVWTQDLDPLTENNDPLSGALGPFDLSHPEYFNQMIQYLKRLED